MGFRRKDVTNDKLVYELHEWAPGAPWGFPEGTSKKDIARYEGLALDALVAAGKIREADRSQVVFIVNFIIKPRFDENGAVIPRNSLNWPRVKSAFALLRPGGGTLAVMAARRRPSAGPHRTLLASSTAWPEACR
jgi:hypothetical protein